jgi:hypothetical protein
LTAWPCKRRPLSRIDGFSSVVRNLSALTHRDGTSLPATCVVPWREHETSKQSIQTQSG